MERRGTFTATTTPLVDKTEKIEYFKIVNGAKKFVYPGKTNKAKEEAKKTSPKEQSITEYFEQKKKEEKEFAKKLKQEEQEAARK